MSDVACPHCTFLNPANRVKCSMCLRLLRKRERPEDDEKTVAKPTKTPPRSDGASPLAASPAPSEEGRRASASPERAQSPPADEAGGPSGGAGHASAAASGVSQQGSQQAQLAVRADTDASPRPAVATLFSTASGRPVMVRPESLQKAAERLGDDAVPREPAVATLFETASGRKVTVQPASLEKAKAAFAALDEAEAPSTATVATLFSTAAGAAVRVSEASLRLARKKLEEDSRDKPDDAPDSPPPETNGGSPAETASPEPRRSAPPALLHSLARPASPTVGLAGGGRRRGFVPPQQRLTAPATPRPVAATHPVAVPSTAGQSTRLPPLRWMRAPCGSAPISPPPALATIMADGFCFTADNCGHALSLLFGVRGAQPVRLPQWHLCMTKLGASPRHCTLEWCRHALYSAMARMASAASLGTDGAAVFCAESVLLCLLQTYNTEMVDGERPALRKVVEGDIPSASLVILYLSSVREERSAPHMRTVTLCDGVYHLRATFDVPLSNLLREGVLRVGQKLAVCGARLLLHGQCSPTECDTQVALAVNYNCVRAVAAETPLGICHGEPPPLPLALVHPLGGLVPAIEGVVARVLPAFFVAQETETVAAGEDGGRPSRDRPLRAVRSHHAQLQVSDRLQRGAEAAEAAAEGKPLSRVTSLLVVKDGSEALVQQWETVEERCLLADDDGSTSLPQEGSWVTLYAVNPAKSRTAAAPFSRAKLFFSSRKLHFAPSKKPLQHVRQIWESTAEKSASVCVGDAVDACGLYVGQHKCRDGTFVLLLLQDGMYAVLQIPVPSAGRSLSFPVPTLDRTPLLVLNATCLTTEDSVAGSDCCRLFANEYTAVTQRSTQGNLKDALARAAALRTVVEAAPQKFAARRAEIFRCLEEGDAGLSGVAPGASGSYSQRRDAMSAAELALESASGGATEGGGSQPFAAAPSREGRLPYYLRQGNAAPSASRKLPGVFIPTASSSTTNSAMGAVSAAQPAQPPRAVFSPSAVTPHSGPPSRGTAGPSRHFGNVGDFMFAYDARLNRRPWHPLDDPLPGDVGGGAPKPADAFQYVQLYWRVSADASADVATRVVDHRAFFDVMEAVCPLQQLCSQIADERHIDVSLQRSGTLTQWRKESRDGLWWRFFSDSRALTSAAELDDADSTRLWWLPAEWKEAMTTLRAKLHCALFYFTACDGALRHTRFITDSCDVRDLPLD